MVTDFGGCAGALEGGALAELQAEEARLDTYLRSLAPLYKQRRELRKTIADLLGPVDLPSPRWRSDLQGKVADCPRCFVRGR